MGHRARDQVAEGLAQERDDAAINITVVCC
jgi:hypothetical protein